jgi:hypothetical protein
MLSLSTDFPGGNLLVDLIEGDTVHLRQDRRDSSEWWFYWSFRIRGAAGRTVRFVFGDGDVLAAEGPCHSRDGKHWQWLGRACVEGPGFTHRFADDEDEGWFALGFPYTESHLDAFLETRPALRRETLVRSEQGRNVELLRHDATEPKGAVLLTCRTHACEAMANYVLEGLLELWLSDDPLGAQLRRHLDLFAVPFVDKDGVEQGDQGKLRTPHDHNRDFLRPARYRSAAALMDLIDSQAPRWRATIDLHCPWIRNADNEKLFFVEGPAAGLEAERRLAVALETIRRGPLPFFASDSYPFGTGWNLGAAHSLRRYAREHTGSQLACTLEVPYAKSHDTVMTPDAARAFGRDLACALSLQLFPASS